MDSEQFSYAGQLASCLLHPLETSRLTLDSSSWIGKLMKIPYIFFLSLRQGSASFNCVLLQGPGFGVLPGSEWGVGKYPDVFTLSQISSN